MLQEVGLAQLEGDVLLAGLALDDLALHLALGVAISVALGGALDLDLALDLTVGHRGLAALRVVPGEDVLAFVGVQVQTLDRREVLELDQALETLDALELGQDLGAIPLELGAIELDDHLALRAAGVAESLELLEHVLVQALAVDADLADGQVLGLAFSLADVAQGLELRGDVAGLAFGADGHLALDRLALAALGLGGLAARGFGGFAEFDLDLLTVGDVLQLALDDLDALHAFAVLGPDLDDHPRAALLGDLFDLLELFLELLALLGQVELVGVGQDELDVLAPAVALDDQLDLGAGGEAAQDLDQAAHVGHLAAVDRQDAVAGLQARALGGAAGDDLLDGGSAAGVRQEHADHALAQVGGRGRGAGGQGAGGSLEGAGGLQDLVGRELGDAGLREGQQGAGAEAGDQAESGHGRLLYS